jgi:hypothetical protein
MSTAAIPNDHSADVFGIAGFVKGISYWEFGWLSWAEKTLTT